MMVRILFCTRGSGRDKSVKGSETMKNECEAERGKRRERTLVLINSSSIETPFENLDGDQDESRSNLTQTDLRSFYFLVLWYFDERGRRSGGVGGRSRRGSVENLSRGVEKGRGGFIVVLAVQIFCAHQGRLTW